MCKKQHRNEDYYGQKNTISEQLKELLNTYDFNINTLSKYLQLPIEQIKNLLGN